MKKTGKVWKLDNQERQKNSGVILEMSQSKMLGNLMILLNTNVIEMKNLYEFTLQNKVTYLYDTSGKRVFETLNQIQ